MSSPFVANPTPAHTPELDLLPSSLWRMLALRRSAPLPPIGFDGWVDRIVGRVMCSLPWTNIYMNRAARVVAMQGRFENLSDEKLNDERDHLRALFLRGRQTKVHHEEGMAVICELAWRSLNKRPYPVQIAAGLAVFEGAFIEMATGEGKTLAASLSAVLAGWRGKGCHVLTSNDYLAARDAKEMTPLFAACGLRVSSVVEDMESPERQSAYAMEVTYLTNKEAAADFLRDRLTLGRMRGLPDYLLSKMTSSRGADGFIQRGLAQAIVDEADSVLIDDAVTPLIISSEGDAKVAATMFKRARDLGLALKDGVDYVVNLQYREVSLTKAGQENLSNMLTQSEPWHTRRRTEEALVQALTAKHLFIQGHQYVVEDGKIVIVDESTGRLMGDRTWRAGLHQAVEVKENVEVTPPKETLARLSFQKFFRMYQTIGGMTGTGWEAHTEFWQVYRGKMVRIPTHKPRIRKQLRDEVHTTKEESYAAVVSEVKTIHATGRPILIGTKYVSVSETLSTLLKEAGIEHQVLNAVHHAKEAEIVAKGGERNAVTVATNMAGRGTDIKLGAGVKDLGGLHVIAVERNASPRIDRQLFGRAGRQGDPGSAVAYVSLEDDLLKAYDLLSKAAHWCKPLAPVNQLLPRLRYSRAQSHAESQSFSQRRSVLRQDEWLEEFLGFSEELV